LCLDTFFEVAEEVLSAENRLKELSEEHVQAVIRLLFSLHMVELWINQEYRR
jgi:hypothetical protein